MGHGFATLHAKNVDPKLKTKIGKSPNVLQMKQRGCGKQNWWQNCTGDTKIKIIFFLLFTICGKPLRANEKSLS